MNSIATHSSLPKNVAQPVPEYFLCPITHVIMKDPVITKEGNSYERTAIIAWCREHNVSPLTGKQMSVSDLIDNRNLRNAIVEFLAAQPPSAVPRELVPSQFLWDFEFLRNEKPPIASKNLCVASFKGYHRSDYSKNPLWQEFCERREKLFFDSNGKCEYTEDKFWFSTRDGVRDHHLIIKTGAFTSSDYHHYSIKWEDSHGNVNLFVDAGVTVTSGYGDKLNLEFLRPWGPRPCAECVQDYVPETDDCRFCGSCQDWISQGRPIQRIFEQRSSWLTSEYYGRIEGEESQDKNDILQREMIYQIQLNHLGRSGDEPTLLLETPPAVVEPTPQETMIRL
eukprot:PhF_6_TR36290/c0_g2_i1/m.52933